MTTPTPPSSNSDNLSLWDKYGVTPTEDLKWADMRGGFWTIKPYPQFKNATAEFGPYGTGWGTREHVYEYIRNAAGDILELTLAAVFFYTHAGKEVSFSESTDIKYRAGSDCRKKVLTDLTTKALSKLGFNHDVFYGLHDKNKPDASSPRSGNGKTQETERLQLVAELRSLLTPEDVTQAKEMGIEIAEMGIGDLRKSIAKRKASNTQEQETTNV